MLPIILTDAIIMFNVTYNLKENQMRDLQHVIERVEYNLRETVDGCILFTNNLYTDRLLVKFLERKYKSYIDYYEHYTELLQNNSLSYNYNYGVLSKIEVIADNDTMLGGGKISTLNMVKDTEWYQAFKESGEDIFLYTYYDETKKFIPGSGSCRTISIIRKLDNIGKKDIEKILKIDIDYNAMLMDVLNEKIDGAIYVRNSEYVLFSNLPNTSGMKTYDLAKSIEEKDSTITTTFRTGNQDWDIVIFAKSTSFSEAVLENKGLLFLIIFNLMVPTILIYLVGRSITHRLSIVAAYMGKVEKEQFEIIQCNEGEDEIGKLIRSYNMMVIKIKDLIEVVFKGNAEKQTLELSKKQAELKAIQSQVNPHFLFNTLETIRMRSLLKGESETADIIGELAILFRKSMNWGPDFITIEEEMNFIEKYINIQKYRFGDKIRFYHYIMEECKNYQIPKLSISSFVENACVHGIEAMVKEGVISLTITKNLEYLFIEISDNGKGFEEKRLEEIRWMISHADSKMLNASKSTGMLNAYLRLRMYSDGQITFDIDSKPENGTDITIRIPLAMVENPAEPNSNFNQEVPRND
jgi:two-component system sensor histidine kinase YesM